jgi:hypothetical protein
MAVQKDIGDLFFHKNKNTGSEKIMVPFKRYTTAVPIAGYGPAYGYVIGSGVGVYSTLGNVNTTRLSSLLWNILATSKNQVGSNIRTNIFTKRDSWNLQGDWRILFFSQPTYGLGIYTGTLPATIIAGRLQHTVPVSQLQPMKFNYVRVYQNFYKK